MAQQSDILLNLLNQQCQHKQNSDLFLFPGFTSYGYFPTTATSNVVQAAGKHTVEILRSDCSRS